MSLLIHKITNPDSQKIKKVTEKQFYGTFPVSRNNEYNMAIFTPGLKYSEIEIQTRHGDLAADNTNKISWFIKPQNRYLLQL